MIADGVVQHAPVSLASFRAVNVPTGEHYEWKEFNTSRWASSGAHLAGKRTVLAEAWTWMGNPNRFGDSLEQLKLCSDLHFLSGINALYGVVYPVFAGCGRLAGLGDLLRPSDEPQFTLLAVLFAFRRLCEPRELRSAARQSRGRRRGLHRRRRCHGGSGDPGVAARTGRFATGCSSNGPPPEFGLANALHYESNVVKTIITNGYSSTASTHLRWRKMQVDEGRLRSGDGEYSVVVLPHLTGIDVESLRKIRSFVDQGGIVIATERLPQITYGMQEREKNQAEVERLVREVFGVVPEGPALQSHRLGNGVAISHATSGHHS